jgi:hypothetical protein
MITTTQTAKEIPMNHPINFSKFNSKLRAGFSIPARRAEFCWTLTFLRDRADAGAFTVLKRSDPGVAIFR